MPWEVRKGRSVAQELVLRVPGRTGEVLQGAAVGKHVRRSHPRCQGIVEIIHLGHILSLFGTPHRFQRVFGLSRNVGFGLLCRIVGELHLSAVNWGDFCSVKITDEREKCVVLGVRVKFYLPLFTNTRFFFPYSNFFIRVAEEEKYLMCLRLSTSGLKKNTKPPISCLSRSNPRLHKGAGVAEGLVAGITGADKPSKFCSLFAHFYCRNRHSEPYFENCQGLIFKAVRGRFQPKKEGRKI